MKTELLYLVFGLVFIGLLYGFTRSRDPRKIRAYDYVPMHKFFPHSPAPAGFYDV